VLQATPKNGTSCSVYVEEVMTAFNKGGNLNRVKMKVVDCLDIIRARTRTHKIF
jgi:hypothetical protein